VLPWRYDAEMGTLHSGEAHIGKKL